MKKLVFTVLFLISCLSVSAAELALIWDANSEPDLAGYKVYRGTTSRQYTKVADLGLVTTYSETVSVPEDKVTTFYYAVTAFDDSGLESDYSNEVFKTFDTRVPPQPPKNLNWFEKLIGWLKKTFHFV
jgi:fibronectin type 3 domain-containing protein